MELMTFCRASGSGLSNATHASAYLLLRMVVLTSWRTALALVSGKVRLAIMQMYGDGSGANGIAKKVMVVLTRFVAQ
jgi:hypothetical protein